MELQVLHSVAWRYLPVEDLLQLCKTSRKFRMLCSNDSTWKLLIRRDFNVMYEDVYPERVYMFYKYNVKAAKRAQRLIQTLDSTYTVLDYTFDSAGNKIKSRDLGSEEITYDYYVKPLIISVIPVVVGDEEPTYAVSFSYTLDPFKEPDCGEGYLIDKRDLNESNVVELFRLFSMFKFLDTQIIDTGTGQLDKKWNNTLRYSGLNVHDLYNLQHEKMKMASYAACKKYNDQREIRASPRPPIEPHLPRSRAFESWEFE